MDTYQNGMMLLSGVVGSTAYGLAHEGSDIDRIGIYAAKTQELVSTLGKPAETHHTTNPDVTYHEAVKALRLLLTCNPTLTEILWLEEYEVLSGSGQDLVNLRSKFLSASRVRDAYLGYATQQFKKLRERGKFNSDINDKRAPKHARHLYRLVLQGVQLYTTGELTVRLENPQECREFGEFAVKDSSMVPVELWLNSYKKIFERKSALPDKPDTAAAEAWLALVRNYMWEY